MAKLNRRERIVVTTGVVALILIALTPLARAGLRAHDRSERQLAEARQRLNDVREWRSALEAERAGRQALDEHLVRRPGRFDLYTFTNNALREMKLEDRATLGNSRIPGNALEGVQLSLNGVSMAEMVDFLHHVYASGNLIVLQRLDHLRPARDGKGLEVQITLMAPIT